MAWAYSYNSSTQVSPGTATLAPGGHVQLTATIAPGCPPFEHCTSFTGTVTWDDGDVGGSFAVPSCTFTASQNLTMGTCTTIYTAGGVPEIVAIVASYSGNQAYSPSTGGATLTIVASPQTTASTQSSTTSTAPPVAGGFDSATALEAGAVAGVAIVAIAVALTLRRRKPL